MAFALRRLEKFTLTTTPSKMKQQRKLKLVVTVMSGKVTTMGIIRFHPMSTKYTTVQQLGHFGLHVPRQVRQKVNVMLIPLPLLPPRIA
jgi:hypothetical protein